MPLAPRSCVRANFITSTPRTPTRATAPHNTPRSETGECLPRRMARQQASTGGSRLNHDRRLTEPSDGNARPTVDSRARRAVQIAGSPCTLRCVHGATTGLDLALVSTCGRTVVAISRLRSARQRSPRLPSPLTISRTRPHRSLLERNAAHRRGDPQAPAHATLTQMATCASFASRQDCCHDVTTGIRPGRPAVAIYMTLDMRVRARVRPCEHRRRGGLSMTAVLRLAVPIGRPPGHPRGAAPTPLRWGCPHICPY